MTTAVGQNWAGSHTYAAERLVSPTSLDELREVVLAAPRVRPLGSRHSFTDIADTSGTLLDLSRMPSEPRIDATARTVRVAGAVRYGDLAAHLEDEGWALGNLASLPHISVAGAVATGTHGSGVRNGSLASAVRGLEVMGADGTLRRLHHGDEELAASVVGLGALGVVVSLDLAIEPTYLVRQQVRTGLAWADLEDHLDLVLGCGYSVSLFTRFDPHVVDQVWVKSRADEPPLADLCGSTVETTPHHMLLGAPTEALTDQSGHPGPWLHRLPHFRADVTPSRGAEIQSEYFVPLRHAVPALRALRAVAHTFAHLLQVTEIRTVAADDLWLSGAYGTDTLAIHFTWVRDAAALEAVLPVIEEALRPYRPRPHWGKAFTMPGSEVRAAYPRMADFLTLRARRDPTSRFSNAFLDRLVDEAPTDAGHALFDLHGRIPSGRQAQPDGPCDRRPRSQRRTRGRRDKG